MTEPQTHTRRLGRPPLWVMSVLVAAAVLFYLVENRPVHKSVVAAKPAATSESAARRTPAHRSTAKQAKAAKPAAPAATIAPAAPTQTPATVAVAPPPSATPATVAVAPPPSTPPATFGSPVTVAPASLMGTLPRTD